MANIQYYDVILKPVITEQSMAGMSEKKYTFLVHTEANKTQIKNAVEKMFEGTKVKKVNTMNLAGKKKRRGMNQEGDCQADGRQQGNRNFCRSVKKAIGKQ